MPILDVKDQSNSKTSFARFVENRLFYKESVDALRFWSERLSPSLGKAIRQCNGIDFKPIMARALHMGDELHHRPAAGALLFESTILPHILGVCGQNEVGEITKYLSENDFFPMHKYVCMQCDHKSGSWHSE